MQDRGEEPFPGVRFLADDTINNYRNMYVGKSEANGSACLSLFIAGCPDHKIEVHTEPPPGYCLTTPSGWNDSFGLALCP